MPKNYYLILGVSSKASEEDIRAAFRRRALKLHPDTSGLESGPFLELQEAYGMLSDPTRRRRYDQEIRPLTARRRPWGPAAEPPVAERPKGEPFRPIQAADSFREVSLGDSLVHSGPAFDELFARWWSNFASISRPKSETLESLTLEILISPEEARRGGTVRVEVPAQATCPACGGHGVVGPYECWRCEGHGAFTTDYPVLVPYPPGTHEGYAVQIALNRFGIENLYLTVLFRVSGDW
jgi:molecular chaperone DnaJ